MLSLERRTEIRNHKHAMRRAFPEDVELPLELSLVKRSALADIAVSVVRMENDKGLKNDGLGAAGGRSKDGTISRDLTPAEDSEAEVTGEVGKDGLMILQRRWIVVFEKDVANGVLARLWQGGANVSLCLTLKERMRDTSHHTGTVTVAEVSTSGTPMGHGAEQLPGI